MLCFLCLNSPNPKGEDLVPLKFEGGRGELNQSGKSDKTESFAFATINKTFLSNSELSTKLSKIKPLKIEGFGELSIIARTELRIEAITKQDEVKFPLMETNLPLMAWCL